MSRSKSYLFSFLLGLFTVIICLAIGDGVFGVEGTIKYAENAGGEYTYQLHINDPTGRIIFWGGLLFLPMIFSKYIRPRHTWINLPLFVVAWYILSAVFGSHANHYFLAHPARGFIRFFEEFDPFVVSVFLWLTQLIVLLAERGIIGIIRKIKHR